MYLVENPLHRPSEHRSKLSSTISSEKTCWMNPGGANVGEGGLGGEVRGGTNTIGKEARRLHQEIVYGRKGGEKMKSTTVEDRKDFNEYAFGAYPRIALLIRLCLFRLSSLGFWLLRSRVYHSGLEF